MIEMDFTPEEDPMKKALRLEAQLNEGLGKWGKDWLCEYRKWLDGKAIRASVDGWPSPEAYHQINIRKFIKEMQDA